MFIKISSIANSGLQSIGVDVEVDMKKMKLPIFEIVGLPAKAISESKERIRAGITNSKMEFPAQKITVNLAPADVPKDGSCYDLPIAVGILALTINLNIPEKSLFFGEISMDGSLRHTKGALLLALFAKEHGFENIFLPRDSANEAAVVKGINVYPVESLEELVYFLTEKKEIKTAEYKKTTEKVFYEFDMQEIIGQEMAKRAVEIAASGGHNIFMVGGPGSGKTMLARALSGILPLLNEEESMEVTKIYSASGYIPPHGSLIENRPFRAPHHTISSVGLIGGGTNPKPGEVTLAHRGVLFLDEINEFQRSTLEALRQPLEDGYVAISRSKERVVYPAKSMFVGSSNPCPCGFLNHKEKNCSCTQREIEKYRKRVSGPILDRVDMHIEVPDVETKKLSSSFEGEEKRESSEEIRKRVEKVRNIQKERFKNEKIFTNAEMRNKDIKKYAKLENEAEKFLTAMSSKLFLSARAYFKIIKLSRTIADMEGKEEINDSHVAEAFQYRLDDVEKKN
jgi:magnesium chelatase family protein